MKDYDILINEFDTTLETIIKQGKDEIDKIYKKAFNLIKNPRKEYAIIHKDDSITIHKKKWYQWFSKKKKVCIEIKPIICEGLRSYKHD